MARVERLVRVLEDHLDRAAGRRAGRSRRSARPRSARRRPSAAPTRAARGPASTCRSRTRRRCPAPRRGASRGRRRPALGRLASAGCRGSGSAPRGRGSRTAAPCVGGVSTLTAPPPFRPGREQAAHRAVLAERPLLHGLDLAAVLRRGGSAARSGSRRGARPGRAARRGSPAPARAGRRSSGTRPAAAACTDAAGWRRRRATGPYSAIWPPYMIATRSHVSASTDRSWVIRIIDRPRSRRSFSSSSRICACIITSSAVVGSSPMISSGLQASARAIITRWRMPPENSCGYCFARFGDADALEQLADARLRAGVPGSCSSIASAIWRPTRMTGSSAFIAPWKTIDTVFQRMSRQPRSVRRWTCITPRVELTSIVPSARCRFCGSRPSSASAVVVLPQPDSPASPSASPRRSWKLTPSISRTSAPSLSW